MELEGYLTHLTNLVSIREDTNKTKKMLKLLDTQNRSVKKPINELFLNYQKTIRG